MVTQMLFSCLNVALQDKNLMLKNKLKEAKRVTDSLNKVRQQRLQELNALC
jgi:hypothetical protein